MTIELRIVALVSRPLSRSFLSPIGSTQHRALRFEHLFVVSSHVVKAISVARSPILAIGGSELTVKHHREQCSLTAHEVHHTSERREFLREVAPLGIDA